MCGAMNCKRLCVQECIPVGCVPSAAVAVSFGRGGGGLPGWSAQGGVCLGVSAQGGLPGGRGCLPEPPLPVDGMTDACEDITFLPKMCTEWVICGAMNRKHLCVKCGLSRGWLSGVYTPPGRHPPRRPLKRVVRILLDCILVNHTLNLAALKNVLPFHTRDCTHFHARSAPGRHPHLDTHTLDIYTPWTHPSSGHRPPAHCMLGYTHLPV